ncbi:MAG TPA: hypothetical protein VF469_19920 [Kofleriaceae bacterium]
MLRTIVADTGQFSGACTWSAGGGGYAFDRPGRFGSSAPAAWRRSALRAPRTGARCDRAGETLAIEIKVWRPGWPDPQAAGLAQLDGYLAGLGLDSGWLVSFDRRPGLPPVEKRLTASEETGPAGNRVTVIRA